MAKFNSLVLLFILAVSQGAYPQTSPWVVSSVEAGKTNPVSMDPKNIALGRNVFTRSCVACHGAKADGNGLIKSSNLLSADFQNQTDGAIHAKISLGRDKMPPFKNTLKDDEIWSVINYLRVLVNPSAMPPPKDVKLEILTGTEIKSITAMAFTADSSKLPIPDLDISFYVKRDLGLMRIGEPQNNTNADGKVKVIFPENIIGDKEGNICLIVKVENSILYNNAEVQVTQKWGMPLVTQEEYFNQRSLWGARDKSPVWLLLLANGIILGIWGAIFYIAYSLYRIKKAGKIFFKES